MNKNQGRVVIDKIRCKGCGLCIDVCSNHSLYLSEAADARGIRTICVDDEVDCTGCALCAVICPDTAIAVYRKKAQAAKGQNSY